MFDSAFEWARRSAAYISKKPNARRKILLDAMIVFIVTAALQTTVMAAGPVIRSITSFQII